MVGDGGYLGIEAALGVAEFAAERGLGHDAEADLVDDQDQRAGRGFERGAEVTRVPCRRSAPPA